MFSPEELNELARRSAAGQVHPQEMVYVIAALREEQTRADRLADGLIATRQRANQYREGLEYLAAAFASVKSRPAPHDVIRFVRSTLSAPVRPQL